jgi:hypothetical protein
MFPLDEMAQSYRPRSPNAPKVYSDVHDCVCPIEDLIEMYQANKQTITHIQTKKQVQQAQRIIVGFTTST